MNHSPILGASLYVPATHTHLPLILRGEKLNTIKELIICTEDAVSAQELPFALQQLRKSLRLYQPVDGRLIFVRPRSPAILREILACPGVEKIAGFVLPKIQVDNLLSWFSVLANMNYSGWIMPTLETIDVFSPMKMRGLREKIQNSKFHRNILTFRIGGNDLLALLNMRRPRGVTVYETPLGRVISELATCFIPYGFNLTAPVYEYLDDTTTLQREIRQDLNFGLVGKTAIHPSQVPLIESNYSVLEEDLLVARAILAPDAQGVFKMNGAMCEPATHAPWARKVVAKAAVFGILDDDEE